VERPPLWAKITDGINAVLWRTPLSHRWKRVLSGSIYRNPPISEARVVETLDALEREGVETCCMGGWGVDALVGEQTRKHRDLDLIIPPRHQAAALRRLAELGFTKWYEQRSDDDPMENRIVLRDRGMRVVDVHPVDFEQAGFSIVSGSIGGRTVQCPSAEQHLHAEERFRKRLPHERRSQRSNTEVARRALDSESESS
jgi:lincosamide nucleotidyltransferase A/C/D/E